MESHDLTPKETFILSVIYEMGEADIQEILKHLNNEEEWPYASVETFLTLLNKKGYVNRIKVGRRFRYSPKQPLADVVTQVLDKLFRGILKNDPSPLINYFMNPAKKLSKREKKLLEFFLLSLKGEDSESSEED